MKRNDSLVFFFFNALNFVLNLPVLDQEQNIEASKAS